MLFFSILLLQGRATPRGRRDREREWEEAARATND
jgi:hypothetical protein